MAMVAALAVSMSSEKSEVSCTRLLDSIGSCSARMPDYATPRKAMGAAATAASPTIAPGQVREAPVPAWLRPRLVPASGIRSGLGLECALRSSDRANESLGTAIARKRCLAALRRLY